MSLKDVFEGFLDINNRGYYIFIKMPDLKKYSNLTIKIDGKLQQVISSESFKAELQTVLQSPTSLKNVLQNLETIIKCRIKSKADSVLKPFQFYDQICSSIKLLEALNLTINLEKNWQTMKLSYSDIRHRIHQMEIDLSPLKIRKHELPLPKTQLAFDYKPDFTDTNTLMSIAQRFIELIDIFRPFWDTLETLDANSWVLEPQTPNFADTFRRLKISENSSVLLHFDPYRVSERPEIDFRGSENEIEQFRTLLENNLLSWDGDVDIHLNLLGLLELEELPEKPYSSGVRKNLLEIGECGICFDARLDGELPENRCDNLRCEAQFHKKCLLKYLYMDLKNSRIGNVILGACPSCRENIACLID